MFHIHTCIESTSTMLLHVAYYFFSIVPFVYIKHIGALFSYNASSCFGINIILVTHNELKNGLLVYFGRFSFKKCINSSLNVW
jgi:hypothetical protein